MSKAGWAVAVLIGIVAAGVAIELQRTRAQLAEAGAAALEAEQQHAAEMERLEAEIRALRAGAPSAPEVDAESADAAQEVAAVQPPAAEEPAEEDEEKDAARERERRFVGAQLGLMMDMAYGPFFEEMELSDELRGSMREVLVEGAQREQEHAQEAMRSKDKKASEIKAFNDENEARVKEALAEVLSPEQLRGFEAYEDYAELILFENLIDGQLTMLSPGLTAEARSATKEHFARGLKVALDEYHESDETYSMDNFNDAQLAGLRLGLDDLAAELDEEQIKHAELFITKIEQVFDALDEGQP